MRRARPYNGITVPPNNGYSAKCIPDATMREMNAIYDTRILNRARMGSMDGEFHPSSPGAKQMGDFVFEHMRFTEDGRPEWTMEIWDHLLTELNDGKDGGPPHYRNSGRSIAKAMTWVLDNSNDCGVHSVCKMSVFSAISPWAEAIMFWVASRKNIKFSITSVDFNPCVLLDIPHDVIAECQATLDLVNSPPSFDLIVSYSGIEHDGLGRYGDPINPNGDVSALREMWLVTEPAGLLFLAVPCAGSKVQPETMIPIWGNKKIHILQHRAYGAERYVRLLVGWDVEGFVLSGRDVVARRAGESKMTTIARMIRCSHIEGENQPLLILRKSEDTTFDQILREAMWDDGKKNFYEEEYRLSVDNQNNTCRS